MSHNGFDPSKAIDLKPTKELDIRTEMRWPSGPDGKIAKTCPFMKPTELSTNVKGVMVITIIPIACAQENCQLFEAGACRMKA